MLQDILIADTATYSPGGEHLTGLRQVNFIFGTNGSGKTTISRVIADPAKHPRSVLTWAAGRALETLVYNRDFAEKNFAANIAGIFTLGEESTDVVAQIDALKKQLDALQDDIDKYEAVLGRDLQSGKRGDLSSLRSGFEEKCWAVKTAHDEHFQEAFSGVRHSKEKFCDRFLEEGDTNSSVLEGIDSLKAKAATVFKKGLERQILLPIPPLEDLLDLENDKVLAKRIVGKDDIDISGLIRRLGNSDWVRQGLSFADDSGGRCPFCQQDMSDDLTRRIAEYFDETFLAEMASLESLDTAFTSLSAQVLTSLKATLASPSPNFDADQLRADIDTLTAKIELNREHLRRKKKEPSSVVKLDSIADVAHSLQEILEAANHKITGHNSIVDNLASEQSTLKGKIWKRLLEDNKLLLSEYSTAKNALDKAVAGLTGSITAKMATMSTKRSALAELERAITSVQPTVTAINSTLVSFGFTSFSLKSAGEKDNFYAIVRSDGSDATPTLSEGERSFITFLYFYHLLRGSVSASGVTTDRVAVFDDPVSSLDSDVLFIVGALIRRVLDEACEGRGRIKQVFLLTHNIYFHKEVTYDAKRQADVCRGHETFWIVRKVNKFSSLVPYTFNPIKTSYELLWAEVKSSGRSNMTIQNVLRRILENYFKILGNIDRDDIVKQFEGQEQQICGSLFSWVNDGSHAVHDDLYVSADSAVVDKYLDVFRRIFEETGHIAHYKMMMGELATTPTQAAAA